MEKLHSYQGWGGRMHEWRDQIRERYANWREQHPEPVIELIKKGVRPSPSNDEYSHIYRSLHTAFRINLVSCDFYSNRRRWFSDSCVRTASIWRKKQINSNYSNRLQLRFLLFRFLFHCRFSAMKGPRLAWNWWKCQQPWWASSFRMLLKLHSFRQHCWALAFSISTWHWCGRCRHWLDFSSRQS